jgi:hypothetical protein
MPDNNGYKITCETKQYAKRYIVQVTQEQKIILKDSKLLITLQQLTQRWEIHGWPVGSCSQRIRSGSHLCSDIARFCFHMHSLYTGEKGTANTELQ